jgi:hypothetical protein
MAKTILNPSAVLTLSLLLFAFSPNTGFSKEEPGTEAGPAKPAPSASKKAPSRQAPSFDSETMWEEFDAAGLSAPRHPQQGVAFDVTLSDAAKKIDMKKAKSFYQRWLPHIEKAVQEKDPIAALLFQSMRNDDKWLSELMQRIDPVKFKTLSSASRYLFEHDSFAGRNARFNTISPTNPVKHDAHLYVDEDQRPKLCGDLEPATKDVVDQYRKGVASAGDSLNMATSQMMSMELFSHPSSFKACPIVLERLLLIAMADFLRPPKLGFDVLDDMEVLGSKAGRTQSLSAILALMHVIEANKNLNDDRSYFRVFDQMSGDLTPLIKKIAAHPAYENARKLNEEMSRNLVRKILAEPRLARYLIRI